MKKGAKIAILVATIVVLLVGGAAVYALTVPPPNDYEDPIPYETRQANTAGSVALARFGIEEYTVDSTSERMLLAYELPEDRREASVAENMQRLVLAAGAGAVVDAPTVVAMQLVDGALVRTWSVALADFRAYEAGDITAEELDAKILKE